jgi:2-polyprenyl-3-methyl-5-hydroxy-6-metoxy-1,4-benzoquinol methylase
MNVQTYFSNELAIQLSSVNWLQHRLIDRYYINGPIETLAIGTGGGNEVFQLTSRGNNVTAIEHDPTAISGINRRMESATGHSGSYECHLGGFESFDTTKRFHYILMSQVLEHIQDDSTLLARLSELAAPHARLVISTPTSLHGLPSRGSIIEPVAMGPNHVRVGYEGVELDALAERSGFLLIKRFYLGNPILKVIWNLEHNARGKLHAFLGKAVSLMLRPIVLMLSVWKCRPYVQISIFTKLPE